MYFFYRKCLVPLSVLHLQQTILDILSICWGKEHYWEKLQHMNANVSKTSLSHVVTSKVSLLLFRFDAADVIKAKLRNICWHLCSVKHRAFVSLWNPESEETGTTRGGSWPRQEERYEQRQCQQRERPSGSENSPSTKELQSALWHWWALQAMLWTPFYLGLCGSDIRGSPLRQEGLTSPLSPSIQNNNCRCWRMSVFEPELKASSLLF